MRLLVTADLHYNHARSRPVAIDLIDRMNQAGGDALLVAGDTAVADGDWLERCLERFTIRGPRLFLCGNHELWTHSADSHALFTEDLPRRVRALGWHWLEGDPWIGGDIAVVGTMGWYDYTFASPALAIPKRFYEAGMSPAAAEYLKRGDLLGDRADIPESARGVMARWNDAKFIHLHRSDETFLNQRLADFSAGLNAAAGARHLVAATHCVPYAELLPPRKSNQWEFARAYLGSPKLGEVISSHANVSHVFCGHSHFPAQARLGRIDAVNIGSGYGWKTFCELEIGTLADNEG